MGHRMKKMAAPVGFGVIGLAFEWSLPFVMRFLFPGDGVQHHGEDEASRQLMAYFLFGGALFFLLGAWVGAIYLGNRRQAFRMIAGLLIGTLVVIVAPRALAPSHLLQSMVDDWGVEIAWVTVWGGISAALAYLLGRPQTRSH